MPPMRKYDFFYMQTFFSSDSVIYYADSGKRAALVLSAAASLLSLPPVPGLQRTSRL